MISFIAGDSSKFSIEYGITHAYKKLSQRALGFFIINVGGASFGVRAPDATLLACSLDAVERRSARKGMHRMSVPEDFDALEMANAVLAVVYDEAELCADFFGMSFQKFSKELNDSEILWAPDGDAAFDDGGHVLQFDVNDGVRLIAFLNTVPRSDVESTLVEARMSADDFYGSLDDVRLNFLTDWNRVLKGG